MEGESLEHETTVRLLAIRWEATAARNRERGAIDKSKSPVSERARGSRMVRTFVRVSIVCRSAVFDFNGLRKKDNLSNGSLYINDQVTFPSPLRRCITWHKRLAEPKRKDES